MLKLKSVSKGLRRKEIEEVINKDNGNEILLLCKMLATKCEDGFIIAIHNSKASYTKFYFIDGINTEVIYHKDRLEGRAYLDFSERVNLLLSNLPNEEAIGITKAINMYVRDITNAHLTPESTLHSDILKVVDNEISNKVIEAIVENRSCFRAMNVVHYPAYVILLEE